jgi:hypothetical protein
LATNIKVKKMSKRFQQERRAKRRQKLLRLFVELYEEFEELVPPITADISNLLSLADIFHQVDRAAGIIKRYKQLAPEAQNLGLEPSPAPQLPDGIMEAYVLIVGRRPRAIPLHFFKEESITPFQQSIKSMFIQGDDRRLVKRYLQLFIEKIIINLPKVEIVAKPEVILAVLENKKGCKNRWSSYSRR